MTQDQKNTGEGGHPAGEMKQASQQDSISVPGANVDGTENLCGAQQPVPATQATGPYLCGNEPPISAPAAQQPAEWGNLPYDLRVRGQWCIAAPNKSPFSTAGFNASVNDPSHWTDWYSATTVAAQWGSGAGIGFVLTGDDEFTCIDLDVKDDTPPERLAQFENIIRTFDSYTERSTSGRGFHIWIRGKVGQGARRDGIEVYSQQRFIICTGNVYLDRPVADRQEHLDLLVQYIRDAQGHSGGELELVELEATESDQTIYERARDAGNGAKFVALWSTPYSPSAEHPSQSEADLALMSILAFYSKSNEQCRRLFRMSELGKREKATKNNRYLDLTLRVIRTRQQKEDQSVEHVKALAEAMYAKVIAQEHSKVERSGLAWPPGVAGQIAQLIYGAAMRPVPEVAIVATLGLLAGVCGNQWGIPKSGLNLYLVLLAKSGIGKEGMHEGIAMFRRAVEVRQPDVQNFFDFNEYASGPALIKATADRSSFVQVSSEFGRRLKRMSDQKDPVLQGLRTAMTKLYSKSGPGAIAGGLTYSDPAKNVSTVTGIAYSMIGESTPGTFRETLTLDMMEDGFLSRFTIIEYEGDRPPENPNPQTDLPKAWVDWFAALVEQAISLERRNEHQAVSRDDQAAKLLQAFNLECDSCINAAGNDESRRQMWNRAHLKALRIAALLAVADHHLYPCITTVHAEWAIQVVRRDIETFTSRMQTGDIGGGDDARESKVLAMLKEYLINEPPRSYKIKPGLHTARIVPRKYLTVRVGSLPAFKEHKLGRIAALDLILKSLVRDGRIQQCNKDKMVETYSEHGECYRILDLPHCD